jgi:REP element-mobilizing transposase RayT
MVKHRTRPSFHAGCPVHVTLRLAESCPSLRKRATYRVLVAAMGGGCERFGMRLVHWSALGNHMHLLVEAVDRPALSRGIQGLAVRMARALNRWWGRSGSVFADRFRTRAGTGSTWQERIPARAARGSMVGTGTTAATPQSWNGRRGCARRAHGCCRWVGDGSACSTRTHGPQRPEGGEASPQSPGEARFELESEAAILEFVDFVEWGATGGGAGRLPRVGGG